MDKKRFLRQIGQFTIPMEYIKLRPESVKQLLSGMIVLEARYRYDADCIEYMALSDGFKEVPIGMYADRYDLNIKEDGSLELQRRVEGMKSSYQ